MGGAPTITCSLLCFHGQWCRSTVDHPRCDAAVVTVADIIPHCHIDTQRSRCRVGVAPLSLRVPLLRHTLVLTTIKQQMLSGLVPSRPQTGPNLESVRDSFWTNVGRFCDSFSLI